jgi:hypothetical protein
MIHRITHTPTAVPSQQPIPGALSKVLSIVLQGVGAAAFAIGSGFSGALVSTGNAQTVPPRNSLH